MGAGEMIKRSGTLMLPESGSVAPEVRVQGGTWISSTGSTTFVTPSEDYVRRCGTLPTAWPASMKAFVLAVTLPLGEVYEPRRRNLDFSQPNQIIIWGDHIAGDVDFEPEPIFAMRPQRSTLWFSADYRLPILPPRRPFISLSDPIDENE